MIRLRLYLAALLWLVCAVSGVHGGWGGKKVSAPSEASAVIRTAPSRQGELGTAPCDVSEAETVQADRGTGKEDVGDSFVPLQVLCEVNGFLVPAIIDTGAQITVMSASCAKRCRISNKIDARFSGRAVGVGSSDIIGRIDGLEMRVGPVSFEGRVSVLRDARVDFLIGLDLLKRFNTEVNLKDHVLKLQVRERWYKVPLLNKNSDLEVPSASSSASSSPSGSFLDDADLSESDFSDEYMAPELTAASSVSLPLQQQQQQQQQQPQYSRQIPLSTRSKEPALSLEGV